MRLPSISLRSGKTWWCVFTLLVAVPALVLALLGVRAARLERVERAQQLQNQQSQLTRLADGAIANVFRGLQNELARAETTGDVTDYPVFLLEPDGQLTFNRDRIYFPDPSKPDPGRTQIWPSDVEQLVERAQAAEAQQRRDEALSLYAQVRNLEPRLRDWAELAQSRLRLENGDLTAMMMLITPSWSHSNGITPGGLPVSLLASVGVESVAPPQRSRYEPLLRATLEGIRGGQWWFQFEERRFYDAELRRLLEVAGSKPIAEDPRLAEWAEIEKMVRRSHPARGVEQPLDGNGNDAFLLLWSPAQRQKSAWLGAAIPRDKLAEALGSTLAPISAGQPFPIAIRNSHESVIWSASPAATPWVTGFALSSAAGWQVAFGSPAEGASGDLRRFLWYGLTGMVVLMLVIGVAVTTFVVRREVELTRLQSEFLAAVTHEFKSPITSIRLLMERLTSGRLRTSARAHDYHDAINRETDRLEQLVNRVLETHKIQSGEKRFDFVSCSIGTLVESAIWRSHPQAQSKGIAMDVEIDAEIPDLSLDKTLIAEALDNLVGNAIKYSPANSRITICVRRQEANVCVEVCDQGIGIDPEDIPRIFDRFYRGRRGDLENVQGTGLGLALVKAAAEGHRGSVEVSSIPGSGSRFCLRLPLEKQ